VSDRENSHINCERLTYPVPPVILYTDRCVLSFGRALARPKSNSWPARKENKEEEGRGEAVWVSDIRIIVISIPRCYYGHIDSRRAIYLERQYSIREAFACLLLTLRVPSALNPILSGFKSRWQTVKPAWIDANKTGGRWREDRSAHLQLRRLVPSNTIKDI